MAFDLYLYRSRTGTPNLEEAISVTVEAEQGPLAEATLEERDRQTAIAQALLQVNPRLQPFELDHAAIAEIQNISATEAKLRYDYLQFNTPEGDLATSIDIYRNHVAITIPKDYEGADYKQVFGMLDAYVQAIHQAAGYFVLDPQTGQTYNPAKEEIPETPKKPVTEVGADMLEETLSDEVYSPKKPWWKFW